MNNKEFGEAITQMWVEKGYLSGDSTRKESTGEDSEITPRPTPCFDREEEIRNTRISGGFFVQTLIAAVYLILLGVAANNAEYTGEFLPSVVLLGIVAFILYKLEDIWIWSFSWYGFFLILGMTILHALILGIFSYDFGYTFIFYLVFSVIFVLPSVILYIKHIR